MNHFTTFHLADRGRPRKLALWIAMLKCLLKFWIVKKWKPLEFEVKPSISYNEKKGGWQIYCRVR